MVEIAGAGSSAVAPVCPTCSALFSGGDGRTCPACGADLPPSQHAGARGPLSTAALHRTDGSADPHARAGRRTSWRLLEGFSPQERRILLVAGLLLVPVSSFLGVRGWHDGWLWIWHPSLAADVVFAAGTVAAFWLSVWLVRHIASVFTAALSSAGIGLLLHAVVYEVSWRVLLAADESEDILPFASLEGVGFVTGIGAVGLLACAGAGAVATALLRTPAGAPTR